MGTRCSCGALISPGALACGLCHAPVAGRVTGPMAGAVQAGPVAGGAAPRPVAEPMAAAAAHAVVAGPGSSNTGVQAAVSPAPVPTAEQPVGPNGFLPAPPRQTLRLDDRQFSRVQASPLSFGPLGRAVISLALITPIWFIWFMSGGGLVNLVFTAPTAALPLWYLRQTWSRHRIR